MLKERDPEGDLAFDFSDEETGNRKGKPLARSHVNLETQPFREVCWGWMMLEAAGKWSGGGGEIGPGNI